MKMQKKKRPLSILMAGLSFIVFSSFAVNVPDIEFPQRGENVTWAENGTAIPDDGLDDSSAFMAAVTRIGSREVELVFPGGTYDVGSNVTFPANITLVFFKGARLNTASGITVTILGEIKAGHYQIISGNGIIAGTVKVNYVLPQWFGAKGDGITNDAEAIQNSINFCALHKLPLKIPYSASGYRIASSITLKDGIKISGDGENVSLNDPDCPTFYLSGDGCFVTPATHIWIALKKLAFVGDNTQTAISGMFSGVIENVRFNNLNYAVNNTEAYHCDFRDNKIRNCNKGLVLAAACFTTTILGLESSGCLEPIIAYGGVYVRNCKITTCTGTAHGGLIKVSAGADIENIYFEGYTNFIEIPGLAAIEIIHSRWATVPTKISHIYINSKKSFKYGLILNATADGEVIAPQCKIENVNFNSYDASDFSGGKIYYGFSHDSVTYYNNFFALINIESCCIMKSDLVNRDTTDPMLNGSVIEFEKNKSIQTSETQINWNPAVINLCGFYFNGVTQLKNKYKNGYYLSNYNFVLENTSSTLKTIMLKIYVNTTAVETLSVTIKAGDTIYVPYTSVLFIANSLSSVALKASDGNGEVTFKSGRVSLVRIMQR